MPRRLVGRVVPALAPGLAGERREQRERLAAVAALEDPGRLGTDEQAAVPRRQRRDLGEASAVLAVREALGRVLPGLTEVLAAPDRGAVPFARGGGEDRPGSLVVDGVVHGPALTERPTKAPVATIGVALEHEASLACSDE